MSKNKFWWRKIFSSEYKRVDYDCEQVWIRNDQFRLVKFESSQDTDGKWGLFTPFEKFLGRCGSTEAPIKWADTVINKEIR